jgi:hypothetical protein
MIGGLSLETIAELAIALAGFSGLIAMIRSGPVHDWHPRARLAFWITLDWSMASVFFAALPSILQPFGVTGWALPSLIIGTSLVLGLLLMLGYHIGLTRNGFPTQNAWHWVGSVSIPMVGLVCTLGSGSGLFSSPSYEWYRLGVLACLLSAVPPFLASFRVRSDEPTDGSHQPNEEHR